MGRGQGRLQGGAQTVLARPRSDRSTPALPQLHEQLASYLLTVGGEEVASAGYEPLLSLFAQQATVWSKPAQAIPGDPGQCHRNSLAAWRAGTGQLVTGFALTDGVWLRHSWLDMGQYIGETTSVIWQAYFGVSLDQQQSQAFADRYQ